MLLNTSLYRGANSVKGAVIQYTRTTCISQLQTTTFNHSDELQTSYCFPQEKERANHDSKGRSEEAGRERIHAEAGVKKGGRMNDKLNF